MDKYTVAWFKIADCVSRGERERALGVYRLLSHSFNDAAIAHQLEGDIYLAFHDCDKAINLYKQSAQLYQRSKRLLEAAALYEHLIMLQEEVSMYHTVIDLYMTLGIVAKVQKYVALLAAHYVRQNEWNELESLGALFAEKNQASVLSSLYHAVIIALKETNGLTDHVHEYTERAINDFVLYDDHANLQGFLLMIQAIDEDLYEYACMYVERV